jgi:hypothetical protein
MNVDKYVDWILRLLPTLVSFAALFKAKKGKKKNRKKR